MIKFYCAKCGQHYKGTKCLDPEDMICAECGGDIIIPHIPKLGKPKKLKIPAGKKGIPPKMPGQ